MGDGADVVEADTSSEEEEEEEDDESEGEEDGGEEGERKKPSLFGGMPSPMGVGSGIMEMIPDHVMNMPGRQIGEENAADQKGGGGGEGEEQKSPGPAGASPAKKKKKFADQRSASQRGSPAPAGRSRSHLDTMDCFELAISLNKFNLVDVMLEEICKPLIASTK